MEGETKGNLNWRSVVRFTVLAVLTLFFLFILFNYFIHYYIIIYIL